MMKLVCKNKTLQKKIIKNTVISSSKISGYGLFAIEKINKGDLILEYVGELISHDEAEKREYLNEIYGSTYMFTLSNKYIIDARTMGGKARFANHSKKFQNSFTKILLVNGVHRVGLFAKQNIASGEEIFFDYDGLKILAEKFSWVDDDNNNNINMIGNKRKKKINNEKETESEICLESEKKTKKKNGSSLLEDDEENNLVF